MLLITQGIIAYAIFWCCWRILRRLIVKTNLDNVPGPASDSFLTGECRFVFQYSLHVQSICIGNFSQIVGINAWGFHKELAQKCTSCIPRHNDIGTKTHFYLRADGGAVVINGFLGVWACSLYEPCYSAEHPLRRSGSIFLIPWLCIIS
jgi:hypothetical protein